jgi:hypothetical protein
MSALRAPDLPDPERVQLPVEERARRRFRRPRLRVVARTAARTRRWPFRAFAAALVGALLVAVVATQALVNQTSFKMRDLQHQTQAIRQTYVEQRLQVADLSAPQRIVREAAALGLRLPNSQDVHVLPVRAPTGAGSGPSGNVRSPFGLTGPAGGHP